MNKLEYLVRWLWEVRDKRDIVTYSQIERGVFMYIGYDRKTIKKYIVLMKKMGVAKRLNRYQWKMVRAEVTNDEMF